LNSFCDTFKYDVNSFYQNNISGIILKMKKYLLKFQNILLIAFIFFTLSASAEFSSPSQTVGGGTAFQYDIETDGMGNWIAVWTSENKYVGQYIYYSKSVDNGISWATPIRRTVDDNLYDSSPEITTDKLGNWLMAWSSGDALENTIGADKDILISKSVNNGLSWTDPVALNPDAATDGSASDSLPRIISDGLGNWLANHSNGAGRKENILRSTDNGDTWITLPNTAFIESFLTDNLGNWIGIQSESIVHSTDNGENWASLVTDPFNGDEVKYIHTDKAGNWMAVSAQGFISMTEDAGQNWSTPLNAPFTTYPVKISTDNVGRWIAVWHSWENIGGNRGDADIFFTRSTDNGVSWSEQALLNDDMYGNNTVDLADKYPIITNDTNGNWIVGWRAKNPFKISRSFMSPADDCMGPSLVINDETYENTHTCVSSDSITTNNITVKNNADLTYRAPDIRLQPTFKVEVGGKFRVNKITQ